MSDDAQFKEWVERARAADIFDAAKRCGARLKKAGAGEWVGPCPACGGTDRFGVNTRDKVWNCRGHGGGQGTIDMVMHAHGLEFVPAVEFITGEDRPSSARQDTPEDHQRRALAAIKREQEHERRVEAERRSDEDERARDAAEIARVQKIMVPLEGTHAAAYLKMRGLEPSPRLLKDLGFVDGLEYWGDPMDGEGGLKLLAELPAMIARIRDADGAVIGLHRTYLDPHVPKKWAPPNPAPPARPVNTAKKMRGRIEGGLIRLGRVTETLAIGEGIETTLAWAAINVDVGAEDVSIAAAGSLGNMSGGAAGSVDHPWKKRRDGSSLHISNGLPDMEKPGVVLPAGVKRVILLGDSDSDAAATYAMLVCGARRFAAQGMETSVHMAPDGLDWADYWAATGGKTM